MGWFKVGGSVLLLEAGTIAETRAPDCARATSRAGSMRASVQEASRQQVLSCLKYRAAGMGPVRAQKIVLSSGGGDGDGEEKRQPGGESARVGGS